ncbi:MAG: hypothetical protein ABGX27_08845 [Desulfurobacteriaceae bacterium]
MILEISLRDKIYIDEDTHDIYKRLKEDLKLFDTMKELFLVAAAVGYYNNKRVPLKRRKDIFSKSIFDKETDIPFIYVLALAGEKSKEVFQKDVLSVVEEYANGGIRILAEKFENVRKMEEAIDEFSAYLVEKFG